LAAVQPVAGAARRSRVLAAGVAGAVVVAVGAVVLLGGDEPESAGPIDLAANTAALIDTANGTVRMAAELGERPGASTLGFGSLWVALPDRGRVARVALEDARVIDTIPVGSTPSGIVATDDAIWVANTSEGTLSRIDPDSNEVTRTLDAGSSPTDLASGSGALWVADPIASRLLRVDPASGTTTTIPLPGPPSSVAHTDDGVWVTVAPAGVSRVDPTTGEVTFTQPVGNGPSDVVVTQGSVWVANRIDGTVSRLDPLTGAERARIPVGTEPSSLVATADQVWVASGLDDAIVAIDAPNDTVADRRPVGASTASLAAGSDGHGLWLMAGASPDEHRGGRLTLASVERPDLWDPAIAEYAPTWPVLGVTHDGLVAYQKSPGPSGTTVVADLAVSLPQISEDGLTYRFVMRDGVRFSTGVVVTPADFRRGIERSVALNKYAANLFGALAGVRRCHREPARCDLSEAIEIDGSAITIKLRRPDALLLDNLALPFGSVVPASTPLEEQSLTDLPGTGPYMVTRLDHEALELERNPEFEEWSAAAQPDGYVDGITWTFGDRLSSAFDRLLAGDLDVLMDEPATDDLATLLGEHPDQAIVNPLPVTTSFGFDVRRPPFDDVRVRRAVSFAVDRARIAQRQGGPGLVRITCDVLPPSLPGFEAACPYTLRPGAGVWSAPDLRRARTLVGAAGARDAEVTVVLPGKDYPIIRAVLLEVAPVLRDLGLRTRTVAAPGDDYFSEVFDVAAKDHPAVFVWSWYADIPRTGHFLETQFDCADGGGPNAFGFCDPRLDARIEAAKNLELRDPGAATREWTAVDHAMVDRAYLAPLTNRVETHAVSRRVGNALTHPQLHFLLSRLWVQ
jgi:peptide/nickel transport system substrate-binding protein